MYFLITKRLEGVERQSGIIRSLREAERSKDDFMANVSHEIRTPVNTICGMSEILLREDLPEAVREDIFNILTAGRSLLSVVTDVLDFSELQSGQLKLTEDTYNITSTVNDVMNMALARRGNKHIEFIVDCDMDIPRGLLGDEQRLRQVIMNIVNNAMKFTEEGCVVLTVSHRDTDYGVNLIVNIKDTGIGMKEESLEKLFTSFNQVDTKRNRQEGGIGLGLAISRAIVEAMGGFIMVHSRYGKGTSVQFVIPQKVTDPAPIARIQEPENYRAIVYVNVEKHVEPEVRDAYQVCLNHIVAQFKVPAHICQNLAEFKRRMKRETYTHVFLTIQEYMEDKAYFDGLAAGDLQMAVLLDRNQSDQSVDRRMARLYKPLFMMPLVMYFNGEMQNNGKLELETRTKERFTAKDAHILVVDDNLMNIRVLEGLVKPYQLKVSMALSGPEALDKIELMDYDLVFMDHMMPEMDGVETMHRIRKKPGNYFRQVPIIALTANAVGGMREVFLKEGFQDFVAKPIEISVLDRVLRRHLPQTKLVFVDDLPPSQEDVQTEAPSDAGSQEKAEGADTIGLKLDPELFDIQKGLGYCGGEENYIEILKLHYKDGEENRQKLADLFEKKDWKNYTILVHALKSSMMSIGAVSLSEKAKKLEQAGKQNEEAYILQNHEDMMDHYGRVLKELGKNDRIRSEEDQEDASDLPALTEAEFDSRLAELEDAVYSFEEEKMTALVKDLQAMSYQGHPLGGALEPVLHKIEMSDYMSALEKVAKLKEKWS